MKKFSFILMPLLAISSLISCGKKYTVTFDSNGGTAIPSQIIDENKYATKPANPTHEESEDAVYAFKEWQLDGSAFEFDKTPITKNITLKAEWIITNKHVVTFDTGEGGDIIPSQRVVDGQCATKPADPNREKTIEHTYKFEKWQKLDGTDFNFNTPITSDITLKAKWTESIRKYTVTFNTDGGESISPVSVNYNTCLSELPTPTHADVGDVAYIFNKWQKPDGTTFTTDTKVTGDITITAIWDKKNIYTVTFDTGKGGDIIPSQRVIDGQLATKPADPTRSEDPHYTYTFSDWHSKNKHFEFTTPIVENTALTAVWNMKVKKYTIRWVNWDDTELKTEDVEYGVTPAYTGETPSREADEQYSYTFSKWSPKIVPVEGATTYRAEFNHTIRSYTVKFESNGGDKINSQTIEYGKCATKPNDPTKKHDKDYIYHFGGWYTDNETFLKAFDFKTAITGDITLYGKWNAVQCYIITIENDDKFGTVTGAGAYEINEPATITATPKDGLSFLHWSKTAPDSREAFIVVPEHTFTPNYSLTLVPKYQSKFLEDYLGYYYEEDKTVSISDYKKTTLKSAITIPGETLIYKNHSCSISTIGNNCYMDSAITSVFMPKTITYIGKEAFANCINLTKVNIPSTLGIMDYDVFKGCTALTTVDIEEGVDKISYGAFEGCTSLPSIKIPNSIESIGTSAFEGCSGLTLVDLTATDHVIQGGKDMFKNCSNSLRIEVPNSLRDKYKNAENWSTYSEKIYGV